MDVSNIENITNPIQKEMALFEQVFADQFQAEHSFLVPLTQHTLGNRGKRLRPILFFLSQGLINPPKVETIPVAVLLEVLHTATLVHDDVIDASRLRRGRVTINARWNDRISILWGDYLFAHVFSIAAKTDVDGLMDIISDVVIRIGTGELRQAIIDPQNRMTPEIYMQIIQEKTASLIAASCELGARTAKAASGLSNALQSFGQSLGTAFQIRDDVLDFLGDPNVMGKPSGQDLSDGILTLPLIFSLQEASQNERDKIIHQLHSALNKQSDQLSDFVKKHHGIEKAQEKAAHFTRQAKKQLALFSASPYRDALENLIQYNLERIQ